MRRKRLVALLLTALATVVGASYQCGRGSQAGVAFDVSPQGHMIVFSAAGPASRQLFSLDLSTDRVTAVTDSSFEEDHPSFSPDGQMVAFSSSKELGSSASIVVCAVDGTERRQITDAVSTYDCFPAFSPDGERIVFARATNLRPYSMGGTTWDDWDVCMVNLADGNVTQVTRSHFRDLYFPTFSADGSLLAFSAGRAAADKNRPPSKYGADTTFILDARHAFRQVATVEIASEPSYRNSRDLWFISDRASAYDYEIWRAGAKGGDQRQVARLGSYIRMPHCSADERSVLFLSDHSRSGQYELWKVGVDGTKPQRIAGAKLFMDPLHWRSGE